MPSSAGCTPRRRAAARPRRQGQALSRPSRRSGESRMRGDALRAGAWRLAVRGSTTASGALAHAHEAAGEPGTKRGNRRTESSWLETVTDPQRGRRCTRRIATSRALAPRQPSNIAPLPSATSCVPPTESSNTRPGEVRHDLRRFLARCLSICSRRARASRLPI
jgi:hypothetical protein